MTGCRLASRWQHSVGMHTRRQRWAFSTLPRHEHVRVSLCSLPDNRSRLRRRGTRSPSDKASELADNLARAGRAHHLLNPAAVQFVHALSDELDCAVGDDVEEIGSFSLLEEWLARRDAHVADVRQNCLKHLVACLQEEAQPLQVAVWQSGASMG